MIYPKEETLEFNHFIRKESLRNDGSNFMTWYRDLKGVLFQNNIPYVIQEFLGDKTGKLRMCRGERAVLPTQGHFLERPVHDVYLHGS